MSLGPSACRHVSMIHMQYGTFLHILFKCCQRIGMTAHRLTSMTYFKKVYKCCRHAVMTAQTLILFTLKDIAKLSTYCEATPYSHMWHVIVPTRRHADTPTCMHIRIYNHYVYLIYISAYLI